MSNNNGDMPAMPLLQKIDHDVIAQATQAGIIIKHKIQHQGLTKREHFAAMAVVPVDVLVAALKATSNMPDSGFTIHQYIEAAVDYKITEADALLAALENKS